MKNCFPLFATPRDCISRSATVFHYLRLPGTVFPDLPLFSTICDSQGVYFRSATVFNYLRLSGTVFPDLQLFSIICDSQGLYFQVRLSTASWESAWRKGTVEARIWNCHCAKSVWGEVWSPCTCRRKNTCYRRSDRVEGNKNCRIRQKGIPCPAHNIVDHLDASRSQNKKP